MIGISKHYKEISLTEEQTEALLLEQQHPSSDEYLVCGCGLPMGKDNYHLKLIGNDEVVAICPLCVYPERIDMIASANMGSLAFIPELTQEQVNAYALFAAYVKEFDDADLEDLVEDINSVMQKRRDTLENTHGEGSSDPAIFCQFLYLLSDEEYANRKGFVKHIRYIPSESVLTEDLRFLKTNILPAYEPKKWRSLLQSLKN